MILDYKKLKDIDFRQSPVEIADRIWWVGHVLENDVFQCHVYLLEQGDQSILFDPGSKLTFRHTFRKIEQIIPFSHIRYFVCHHQDPDITGALTLIDELVARKDAVIITHWRSQALLKHYALSMPFWLVDEHEWQLQLEDRLLKFILTPYAHFPGAFCTFDTHSQVMLSSDLFGGFTEKFSLFAKDESYFECLRPFHEHYMPNRDILCYAMAQLEQYPIRMILPQHGSIIPEQLVDFMIRNLKELDCGLFLLTSDKTDIQRLSRLNQILRDITRTMVMTRDFQDIVVKLLEIAKRILPVHSLEFYCSSENGALLHFDPANRYRGAAVEAYKPVSDVIGRDNKYWRSVEQKNYKQLMLTDSENKEQNCILLPLFSPDEGKIHAVAIIRLSESVSPGQDVSQLIEQLALPLEVTLERETIYRMLDLERQRIYERSIHDPLTGLYTRQYMYDTIQRLQAIHDRDRCAVVALVMVDIDHFKNVNDTYGHNQGDVVLKQVAAVLIEQSRKSDLPIRLGGEEFVVFIVGESVQNIKVFAERIRETVSQLKFDGNLSGFTVTISAGVAIRNQGEQLTEFIERADKALYQAKEGGRNRVCVALNEV